MNVKKGVIYGCLSLTVLLNACDKDDDQPTLSDVDRNYLMMAGYSNQNEIDAGTLASTKGNKDSTKMYGMMMVADHQKANASLDSLAKAKGVTLPTGPDAEHVAIKQVLSGLSGRNFDTAYINGQVRDHLKTINLFQTEIQNGTDQNIKDWANKNLPIIQMHYRMADTLSKKL